MDPRSVCPHRKFTRLDDGTSRCVACGGSGREDSDHQPSRLPNTSTASSIISMDDAVDPITTTATTTATSASGSVPVSRTVPKEERDGGRVVADVDTCDSELSGVLSGHRFGSVPARGRKIDQDADIHRCLRKEETFFKPDTLRRRYVEARVELVPWIISLAKEMGLHATTWHLGVRYLDRILLGINVSRSKYHLVSVCCLLLAAKMEEMDNDHDIPKVADLCAFTKHICTPEDVVRHESLILRVLEWRLMEVTAAHFINYYCEVAVTDDCRRHSAPVFPSVATSLSSVACYLVDFCLCHSEFLSYVPSLIAASSICASRLIHNVSPLWTGALEERSGYRFEDVRYCAGHIYSLYTNSRGGGKTTEQDRSPSVVTAVSM